MTKRRTNSATPHSRALRETLSRLLDRVRDASPAMGSQWIESDDAARYITE